jgi:hypothetical protein
MGPLAVHRAALDHRAYSALESLPSIWVQLDF